MLIDLFQLGTYTIFQIMISKSIPTALPDIHFLIFFYILQILGTTHCFIAVSHICNIIYPAFGSKILVTGTLLFIARYTFSGARKFK